jgi:serine/threonine protein kinase
MSSGRAVVSMDVRHLQVIRDALFTGPSYRPDGPVGIGYAAASGSGNLTTQTMDECTASADWSGTVSLIGRTISHYRILEKLGTGGMGVIYRAQDMRLRRHVALKFPRRELPATPLISDCIRYEAYAASSLNHPNVCSVYDIGEFEGKPFFVMELLEGRTLQRLIENPFALEKFFDLAIQIVSGLDAIHARGIVHRDIKPSNIFITASGRAKVFDFGLATLAHRQPGENNAVDLDWFSADVWRTWRQLQGTPAYMSPEQVRGEPLDGRSDLFSLGAVFYQMLTADRPFIGDTTSAVLNAVLHKTLPALRRQRPSLPASLVTLVERALEKDRAARFQSAAELGAQLKRVQRAPVDSHTEGDVAK